MATIGNYSKSFLREQNNFALSINILDKNGDELDLSEYKKNNIKTILLNNNAYERCVVGASLLEGKSVEECKTILSEVRNYLKERGFLGIVELHASDTTVSQYHFHYWGANANLAKRELFTFCKKNNLTDNNFNIENWDTNEKIPQEQRYDLSIDVLNFNEIAENQRKEAEEQKRKKALMDSFRKASERMIEIAENQRKEAEEKQVKEKMFLFNFRQKQIKELLLNGSEREKRVALLRAFELLKNSNIEQDFKALTIKVFNDLNTPNKNSTTYNISLPYDKEEYKKRFLEKIRSQKTYKNNIENLEELKNQKLKELKEALKI
ncbi:hypothetical protein [Campylobacter sp. RM12651]|uniref:hypothetical protein n=1 Tax=Campylobacter sp. RM12651 TaxID=1660079 RepID=UPI001EFB3A88|nr:hypothetical protein [Campylobacter sp. RM12651]ULO04512.1 hypothetical protein AVBRAN_a0030 [Campylobacter sp. RM12651]